MVKETKRNILFEARKCTPDCLMESLGFFLNTVLLNKFVDDIQSFPLNPLATSET